MMTPLAHPQELQPRNERRRWLMLGGLGAALAPVWAGLAGCAKSGPHRLGFLGGLSGRMADLGVAGRNGAQLAIEQINAAGGVAGRMLELVPLDDEHNVEVAKRRLQEFADAGVRLVVGPMTSAVAVGVAPLGTQLGVAMISPTASARELAGKADALFCLAPQAPHSAAQHAEFLFSRGLRALAMVQDFQNKSFTQDWAQGLEKRWVELGGRVALDTHYVSAPGLNYGEIAQQLVAAKADVIALITGVADTALLSQQIRQRDDKVQLTATPWAAHDQLLKMGGRAVEGMTVAQLVDRGSQAPGYLKFAAQYSERFTEVPGYRSIKACDAVLVAAEALRQQQRGQSMVDAVRQVRSLPGLQATLALNEFGDSTAPVYMTLARGGRYEPLARP